MSEDPFADVEWVPVPSQKNARDVTIRAAIIMDKLRPIVVISGSEQAGFPPIGTRVQVDMALTSVRGDIPFRLTPDDSATRKVHKSSKVLGWGSVRFSAPPFIKLGAPGIIAGAGLHPRGDGVVVVTIPEVELVREDRVRRASPPKKVRAAPRAEAAASAKSAYPAFELAPRKVRPLAGGKWDIEGDTYTAQAVILTINNQRRRKGLPLLAPDAELVAA